jgi:hypothetical protein
MLKKSCPSNALAGTTAQRFFTDLIISQGASYG